MALDYRKCAEEIVANIGGRENVAQAAHCATRLRLVIKDNGKINKAALENVDGVKGMFENNGQLQLIIGTGTVNKVYDEFLAVTGMSAATKDDVKNAAAAQQPIWKRILKSIGDVFVPILPAIVASGLLMGVVEALGKAIPTFGDTAWYAFLDMVSNTAFAFLPVIVAISAARVFGGNVYLAAVIGLMMVHTSLLNGWNVGNVQAINDFFGVTDGVIPTWNLFGNIHIGSYVLGSISRHGYQGHVIPVMLSIWLMCKIEKWLHKVVPEMIDLFVVPITTVFLTALATFIVIGPIFATLETYVLKGAQWLVQFPPGALIMGAVYPITVVMGLHHMYNVIEAGMLSSVGLNTWMPIASAANFAQFGACLAVGLKCRNAKLKTVAIPSSMSAALGITEPAIFGVNFRFMKPFIFGMIGGAVGGLFGSITHLGASAYGVTGIPGYLTINNPLVYTILLAIAGGVAFALTFVLWKEDPDDVEKPADQIKAPTETVITTEKGTVIQPVNGTVITASEIPDPMFAGEAMGPAIGINPTDGIVFAPFDGKVTMLFPTNHAVGLTSKDGLELLIHVGVDTVNMNGDGFASFVKADDEIKQGDKLLTFDRSMIKEAGYSDCVIVALTNGAMFEDVKKIK